jgi:hypothetical protein
MANVTDFGTLIKTTAPTAFEAFDALLAKCRAYVSQFRNVMIGLEVVDLLNAEGLYAEILGSARYLPTLEAADRAARRYLGAEHCDKVQSANIAFVHSMWR